jgi:hypothetical protein
MFFAVLQLSRIFIPIKKSTCHIHFDETKLRLLLHEQKELVSITAGRQL